MPGEMRAALNKFFTPRYYKMRGEAPAKNLGIFRKKLMVYYFSVLTIVDPLKWGPGQIFPMPSFLI